MVLSNCFNCPCCFIVRFKPCLFTKKGVRQMQNTTIKNNKPPFNCYMLCVSLIGASVLLILIFLLYFMDLISTEVAIWSSMSVFFLAAFYEMFLVSLVTLHSLKSFNEKPSTSSTNQIN